MTKRNGPQAKMKNITAQMGTTSMMDKNSDALEHVLRRYVPSGALKRGVSIL